MSEQSKQSKKGSATMSNKGKKHRVRDDDFQAILARYGLTRAPVLNINEAIEAAGTPIESVDSFKLKDYTTRLTIDRAVEYVQLPVFRGEREPGDEWAQYLLGEMVRGSFNWDLVILARCKLNGVEYKVNGQHTCWARLDVKLTNDPLVREIVYSVDTDEQLRRIYRTFDRVKIRSDPQLMQIELMGQDLDPEITKTWATLAASGLRLWKYENKESYRRARPEQISALVASPEIKPIFTVVCLFGQQHSGAAASAIIKRQAVVAAMLVTFTKDPAAAATFWADIADGTNLVKGDPRWLLYNYLVRSKLYMRSGVAHASSEHQVVNTEDMYRVCLNMWNKWRAGEQITVVRAPAQRPLAL
jgi:hypothetical protein